MKRHINIIILFSFLTHLTTFAQCIDKAKITYGGDWGFVDFIHRCPTYNFAFDGDTSKNWNVLTDPIDIKQAPPEVLLFKQRVEKKIIEYSGADFFSKIKFNSVEVVYSDMLKAFKDSGRQDVTLEYCKAKYFFYYEFKIDTLSTYHIGIASDKKGDIISKFNFPSKANYTPVDEKFDYCKLIDIGRKAQPNIDPIKDIKLEFDNEKNRFYWLLTQEIVNSKEGINYFNQVQIDASNLSITKNIKGCEHIIY
jgi:hypothetical protein